MNLLGLVLIVTAGLLGGRPESRIPDWRARVRESNARVLSSMSPIMPSSVLNASAHLVRPDTARVDSLPSGMPIVTRAFWGRHGMIRVLGLAPETRAGELRLRRSMLQWHQRLALVTLGAMTAQVITGQLVYGSPEKYYEDLQPIHKPLGYATFGLYTLTASMSLGAPPARRYGSGVSSVKIHRYLAIIHFAGMMAQPWLGRAAARADSPEAYDRAINRHLAVGWITYGAFVTSALVVTFLP